MTFKSEISRTSFYFRPGLVCTGRIADAVGRIDYICLDGSEGFSATSQHFLKVGNTWERISWTDDFYRRVRYYLEKIHD